MAIAGVGDSMISLMLVLTSPPKELRMGLATMWLWPKYRLYFCSKNQQRYKGKTVKNKFL